MDVEAIVKGLDLIDFPLDAVLPLRLWWWGIWC